MKKTLHILFLIVAALASAVGVNAQGKVEKPAIIYGQSRNLEIGGITVEGNKIGYESSSIVGLSGLSVGERINVPGDEVTEAIERIWKHGLFSEVSIEADSIVGDKVYLKFVLAMRPRVSTINIEGVKKSEREDIEEKIGIIKGSQITPNMVDKAEIIIKNYFEDKGFKNADVNIVQRDDVNNNEQMIVDIIIDKKEKVKVNKIYITGNNNLPYKKFTGGFFGGGLLKKTNEKGFKSLFKSKKFITEKYDEDKDRVIEKYNELGKRDDIILADSVVDRGDNTVDVYIDIDDGQKY